MNRKEFLDLIGRSALFAATAPAFDVALGEARPRSLFTARHRLALRALADEIVPAADGMPSAGELDAVAFLERLAGRDKTVASALRDAIASLERRARAGGRRRFEQLSPPERLALLVAMEEGEAERFRAARDLVYEAYYTHPVVWRRLGYDFIGPDRSGPALQPFEEALLERVRAMNRIYRTVP
jgi:hypothetical protein